MPTTPFFIGPHSTPKPVKWLIVFTLILSLLSPLLTFLSKEYFQSMGPGMWLSLSLFGLKQGWYWQPLTYFFVHTAGIGISFSLLIALSFHMFLLWFAGSEIHYRFGWKKFFFFYLSAGCVAGLLATWMLYLTSSRSILLGSGPPLNALLIIWAMANPELKLFFFFFLRLKAKWLVGIYFLLVLLFNLSSGAFIPCLANLTAIVWGFFLGRIICKLPNPYPLNLEFPKSRRKQKVQDNKIIDISVFQESDDAFMERMLDKISQKGEIALTKRERDRMKKISNKKKES